MNALEQFHIDLDKSGWDVKQESDINQALQKVNDLLFTTMLPNIAHFAEIERQTFQFNKSPEKRLSFRAAGTQKMEDGSEIPFEWPDIKVFEKKDFDYIYKRFKTCINIYAKTEYGLVLYYSKNKQDNDFVIELVNSLFDLLKTYIEKARSKDDKGHYIIHAGVLLANALHIANNRKKSSIVEVIFKKIIKYIFEVHQNWDVSHSSTLRTIIDLTDFAIQYLEDFQDTVHVNKFNDKNWEAAKFLSNTYVWGAIYVADISIKLCRKSGRDINDWLYFKAEQFEKLSIERKEHFVSVTFVENAMSIYKSLKDKENLIRLQKKYQQLRTEFQLGKVRKEMPQDETQRIMELIKKEIKEKSEEEIIKTLLQTPMILPLEEIKQWSDESFSKSMLQNLLPFHIKDKYGNTVAQYETEEEREKLSLLRTYAFHMQIATQTIVQFFVEAFREDKISADGIISLLNQTWIGEEGNRRSYGQITKFSYIKLIESGIKSFFDELNKWNTETNYSPNFVSATDTLVLKAEYFLREICRKLDISTFQENSKQQGIIMEKTLDVLISNLTGRITNDDHFFIKFILTEKIGYNLRNRVAHGLMDNVEYSIECPILAIIIILKLSNYQFA